MAALALRRLPAHALPLCCCPARRAVQEWCRHYGPVAMAANIPSFGSALKVGGEVRQLQIRCVRAGWGQGAQAGMHSHASCSCQRSGGFSRRLGVEPQDAQREQRSSSSWWPALPAAFSAGSLNTKLQHIRHIQCNIQAPIQHIQSSVAAGRLRRTRRCTRSARPRRCCCGPGPGSTGARWWARASAWRGSWRRGSTSSRSTSARSLSPRVGGRWLGGWY